MTGAPGAGAQKQDGVANRGRVKRARRHGRPPKGTVELIDSALLRQLTVRTQGTPKKITVFEAILSQLWTKEMKGDRRAHAVRLKYLEFASSRSKSQEFVIIPTYQPWAKKEMPE